MTDELLAQIVTQAPTVAILVYLLIRLDQRMSTLIDVICEMAQYEQDDALQRRLQQLASGSSRPD